MNQLQNTILEITKMYLGPAAQVFLERQAKFHMGGISFQDINESHIPELLKWIRISAGLIIDNKAEALVVNINTALKKLQ